MSQEDKKPTGAPIASETAAGVAGEFGPGAGAAGSGSGGSGSGHPATGPGTPGPDSFSWMMLIAIVLGTFVTVLNNSLINVALPKLVNVFGSTT
ncbi:hypothetical protein MXD81_11580, partial [Microbacteriaceae bacterium K1510]|nr:hypothetical protein [Microbacteriaceae bacterium K1510]